MKTIAYTLLALLAATPASAQSWTGSTEDSGSLLFGWATVEGYSLGFGCTAPSPQGLGLMETGSHESHRTDPFEVVVTFRDDLFDWQPPYVIEGIVLSVNDVGYGLPPLQLDELLGSGIYLPMTDQMVLALLQAERLVLDTGQGTAYEYPVDGLPVALTQAFSYCNARWVEMGNALPDALAALSGSAGATPPRPPLPQVQVPEFLSDRVAQACPDGGTVDADVALGQADFDGDGRPDYIVNGLGLSCNDGFNPFCGAAQCSVDVHLSSADYASVYGWIGLDFHIGTTPNGRVGLARSPAPADQLLVWTGEMFELAPPPDPYIATSVPPQLLSHVAGICGDGFAFTGASRPLQGNIDGDGQPDYVVGWRDMTCPEANVIEYCGASACNIDVFLSSLGYTATDAGVGPSVGLAPLTNGRDGVGTTIGGFPVLQMWVGTGWTDAMHLWSQTQ